MEKPRDEKLRDALKTMISALETQNQRIEEQNQHLNTIISLLQPCDKTDMYSSWMSGTTDTLERFQRTSDSTHEVENGSKDVDEGTDTRNRLAGLDEQEYGKEIQGRQCFYDFQDENLDRMHGPRHNVDMSRPRLSEWRDAGVITADWKYWRPVETGRLYSYLTGRGRPDYIPEWELSQRKDGTWYHIDNPTVTIPVIDGKMDRSPEQMLLVPYALSPPMFGEGISFASLQHTKDQIKASLGQLFAVPPDSRVPLRFEKNQLRRACEDGTLDSYLKILQEFFTRLHKGGGFFRVTDFDDFMNSAPYDTTFARDPRTHIKRLDQVDPEDDFPAGPALAAEEFRLNILPSWYRHYGKPTFRYTTTAGRWHRVIHCHGLAHMSPIVENRDPDPQDAREERSRAWKLFFRDNEGKDSGLGLPRDVLDNIFRLHVFCGRRQQSHDPYLHGWEPFHLTWYRITGTEEHRNSVWKSGTLYRTKHRLEQASFTFGLFPNRKTGKGLNPFGSRKLSCEDNFYWTSIMLTPLYMDTKSIYTTNAPQTLALHLIAAALYDVANSLEGIARCMAEILVDDDATFDPDKHDRLLFDDNAFSRSRRYFWAIDILETFRERTLDSITQWNYWWAGWEHILRDFEKHCIARKAARYETDLDGSPIIPTAHERQQCIDDILPKVKSEVVRLKVLETQFQGLLEKTQKLRDGLFSASSVIESRAATDLGQNVKLLTYVSIFYMPLSACASVWGINEDFGAVTFGIVTAVVAVATYIFVANLNSAVRAMQATYRALENRLVEDMMRQSDDKYWADKGRDFKQFRPDRADIMPSKWLILWYAIVKVFRSGTVRKVGNETEIKLDKRLSWFTRRKERSPGSKASGRDIENLSQ